VIDVNQALCAGCGICVDDCPTGAIFLVDGSAQVDAGLCDGCGVCIPACPNHALAWIPEPVPELPVVVEPPIGLVPYETRAPVRWRQAIVPAVGGALTWVGRQVVPRFVPLALDVLEGVLDRRSSQRSRDPGVTATPAGGRGRRQRNRRRRGRAPE
jgi:Pyruvate/2-oxoacid:ferredoxin oxidoreductase delta subunit